MFRHCDSSAISGLNKKEPKRLLVCIIHPSNGDANSKEEKIREENREDFNYDSACGVMNDDDGLSLCNHAKL